MIYTYGTYHHLSKIIRSKTLATHKPIVTQINLESVWIKIYIASLLMVCKITSSTYIKNTTDIEFEQWLFIDVRWLPFKQ